MTATFRPGWGWAERPVDLTKTDEDHADAAWRQADREATCADLGRRPLELYGRLFVSRFGLSRTEVARDTEIDRADGQRVPVLVRGHAVGRARYARTLQRHPGAAS